MPRNEFHVQPSHQRQDIHVSHEKRTSQSDRSLVSFDFGYFTRCYALRSLSSEGRCDDEPAALSLLEAVRKTCRRLAGIFVTQIEKVCGACRADGI